jgi:hypothetical protein
MRLRAGLRGAARGFGPAYGAASRVKAAITENRAMRDAPRQIAKLAGISNPFFVVGVPGSLHIIDLCLACVPSDIDVILVSNAMEAWEQRWAAQNLNVRSVVTLGSRLEHGRVLDLLLDHFRAPFGILDYDCFVFNPSYFHRLTSIAPRSMLNALFQFRGPGPGIEFPETFMLFFNSPVVRSLRRRYRASCRQVAYSQLPGGIRKRLAVVGIDATHMPEGYKSIFDTLRLVLALGMAEGHQCNFVERFTASSMPLDQIFHVGAVAYGDDARMAGASRWNLRGAYFWRRALECHEDADLRRRYRAKFGDISASQLLADSQFSRYVKPEFLSFVERVVNRESPPFRSS